MIRPRKEEKRKKKTRIKKDRFNGKVTSDVFLDNSLHHYGNRRGTRTPSLKKEKETHLSSERKVGREKGRLDHYRRPRNVGKALFLQDSGDLEEEQEGGRSIDD